MSLPITARQMLALKALQHSHPELGDLASAIALAFDATKIENPHMARLILEKTCRRIVNGQPGGYEALTQHLGNFARLECLSPESMTEINHRIQKLILKRTLSF